MKAIIPAAGIGTRLRPHTLTRPKVMLTVAGKPIIGHIADTLMDAGIHQLSVIVGYKKERIIDYFSKISGLKCEFPIQKEMMGLGHAVLYGLEAADEPVLIILGDTIINTDYKAFISRNTHTLGVVPVDDPRRFGIVETDEKKRILSMVEKPENPPGNLAIAGLYLIRNQGLLKESIEKLIRDNIKTRNEYQLTDALKIMMDQGEVFTASEIDSWLDCGKMETLLETNRQILERKGNQTGKTNNCVIIPPVYIAPDAQIKNSVIGPYVSVSSNSIIHNSVIRDSIVYEDAVIQQSLLSGAIIGQNVSVKGELKALNLGDYSEAF